MSENKNGKRVDAASKKAKNSKKAHNNNNKAVATNKNKHNLQVAQAPKNEVQKVDPKTKAAESAASVEKKSKRTVDIALWTLSFIILAFAVGGNYYYTQFIMVEETSLLRLGRVAAVIAIIAIGLAILLFTTAGKRLLTYGRDSYTELRKVVWPTRQEGLQTTFIVFIAVSVVSLFLYLCDLAFLQIVRVITI